jgi:WD40 repeat protein
MNQPPPASAGPSGAVIPTGLAAAISSFRPSPRAPVADELRAVSVPAPGLLERVMGQPDMVHRELKAASFAADGRTVVSVGHSGDLIIWDAVSRAPRAEWPPCPEHRAEATSLALSADGRFVAQGDFGGNVCVRDIASGRVIRAWKAHEAPIVALVATADGELVTYGYQGRESEEAKTRVIVRRQASGGELRWWRLDQERPLREIPIGPAEEVKLASDQSMLIARLPDGHLRAWNREGHALWSGDRPVVAFAFISAGELITVERRGVFLVGASTGNRVAELLRTTPAPKLPPPWNESQLWSDCLVVSPDGREAMTSLVGDSHVFVWDTAAHRERARVPGRALGACWAPASYSADGTVLMTAASDHLLLWDAVHATPLPDRAVRTVALSNDARRAVTFGDDDLVRVWDVDAGRELARWRAQDPKSVSFSKDGRYVIEQLVDGGSRISDATSGAPVGDVSKEGDSEPPHILSAAVTVSPEASGTAIHVSRPGIDALSPVVIGKRFGDISSFSLSSDGHRLLTGTSRGLVLVFRI